MADPPDPPPRSLYLRPGSPEEGGDLIATCDCGTSCRIQLIPVDPEGHHLDQADGLVVQEQEIPYECDGCHSVTWLRLGPGSPLPPGGRADPSLN